MFFSPLQFASRKQVHKFSRSLVLTVLLTTLTQAAPSFEKRIFEGSQTYHHDDSKHFVIVIPSYNNQQWYLKNITSACDQEYHNYEIIFTDDCSSDKTGDLVEDFLHLNPPACKVTLIKNHARCGAFQNIYRAISWCKPTDIIVSLDGDDWLADSQVLSHLNSVYANENVWMTHGQLQVYPSGEIFYWTTRMPDHVVKENSYRWHEHIPTHLRTFYVWLFRNIKLEDLLHEGSFFPMTWDMAFMIPMMELSNGNHAFIDKVLYIYNEQNPLNDFKINKGFQRALDLKIRSKNRYSPIEAPTMTQRSNKQLPISLCIISDNNPDELKAFINSVQEYVRPLDHIYVTWHARETATENLYQEAIASFPQVIFSRCATREDLSLQCLLSLRQVCQDTYVLLSHVTTPFTSPIDLDRCIQGLENTQAYGFYFFNQSIKSDVKHVDIDGQIKGWNFAYTPEKWKKNSSCIAALYKRHDAMNLLLSSSSENMVLLPGNAQDKVGLFVEA